MLYAFVIIDVYHFLCSRFKFDDERVTKEDMKRALEEQYGGEEEVVVSIFADALLSIFVWKDFILTYLLEYWITFKHYSWILFIYF